MADREPTMIVLPYGTTRRRLPRWVKWLAVLIVIAAACLYGLRLAGPHIQYLTRKWSSVGERQRLYDACTAHTYLPGTIIFDEVFDPEPPLHATDTNTASRVPRPAADLAQRPGTVVPQPLARRWLEAQDTCWRWGDRRPMLNSAWNELMHVNDRWTFWGIRVARGMGSRYGNPRNMFMPPGWVMGDPNSSEVLVHALRTPSGRAYLVGVGFDQVAFVHGDLYPFRCAAIAPLHWNRLMECTVSGRDFALRIPPEQPLKLYAGQVDPLDPTHFTIRYQTPAGEGSIDGYLQDDATVRLQVRGGPAE